MCIIGQYLWKGMLQKQPLIMGILLIIVHRYIT